MKKYLSRALAVAAAISLPAEQAAADMYLGGSVALLEYRQAGYDEELSLPAAVVKFGGQFSENLSAEVRFGFGIDDDDTTYLGRNNDVKLDSMYGVYLKAGVPVANTLYPYAIIGWTELDMVATVYGYGRTSDGRDTSYGLGMDVYISDATGLSLEYINYYDKSSTDISGISIGIHTRF